MTEEKQQVYIPARQVRTRYEITDMTIWRWLRDPRVQFPQPIYLGRFRHWRLSDLEAWEAERERASIGAGAA